MEFEYSRNDSATNLNSSCSASSSRSKYERYMTLGVVAVLGGSMLPSGVVDDTIVGVVVLESDVDIAFALEVPDTAGSAVGCVVFNPTLAGGGIIDVVVNDDVAIVVKLLICKCAGLAVFVTVVLVFSGRAL